MHYKMSDWRGSVLGSSLLTSLLPPPRAGFNFGIITPTPSSTFTATQGTVSAAQHGFVTPERRQGSDRRAAFPLLPRPVWSICRACGGVPLGTGWSLAISARDVPEGSTRGKVRGDAFLCLFWENMLISCILDTVYLL